MEDSVTRVTYRRNPDFVSRFCGSLGGLLIGVLLLLGGCGLLFWNEGRAVVAQRSLDEGHQMVRELTLTGEMASLAHDDDGEPLVHLTGTLFTPEELRDSDFDVAVSAVALKRTVQMFQWREHRETRDYNEAGETRTETTYSYTKEWSSDVIDSRGFERPHPNPRHMPISSKKFLSHLVKVRGLILSEGLVSKIDNYKVIRAKTVPQGFQRHDDFLYRGRDPYNPEIGDVRLIFEVAGVTEGGGETVSVVARKEANRLKAYRTKAGNDIELLYMGDLSAKEIFEREIAANNLMTWGLRLGGWLVIFIALSAMTRPVQVLVDWLPIVRELVNLGLGAFNFFLSSTLSVFIIALGWIRYRPLLGWSLVLMGATPYVIGWLRRARGISGRGHRD